VRTYVFRRLGQTVITLWLLLTIIFLIFRFIPGDPLAIYVDVAMPAEVQEAMMRRFGLDRPVHEQYLLYLRNVLQGDLGQSFHYRRPVTSIIGEKFLNTIVLMGIGVGAAYVLGALLGAISAWRRGTKLEQSLVVVALSIRSMPIFWLGILLLIVFGMWLGWLPLGGMRTPGYEAAGAWQKFVNLDFLAHLILPAVCLALYYLGTPLLITRSAMLETLNEEYIELARAKGLREWAVMTRHALRNSLLPVLTLAPVMMSFILGGQVMLETIFRWPGIGREIVFAVNSKDFPLAQALFFLMAMIIVSLNFLVDLLYGYLDPRVSVEK
jgi:peptide/nickel transport system permease protein